MNRLLAPSAQEVALQADPPKVSPAAGNPLVSVVIAARNAEATLQATLDSLIAQDVADWEAIIVDDASTDGTPRIAANYARRDGRFRTLTSHGEGAAGARNVGIAAASGRWLLFLDSDDWVDPSFLAKMSAALEADPDAVAACCGFRRAMPDGTLTPARTAKTVAREPFESFARRCGIAIHSLLVDRSTIVELGGFDVSLRTCEDWDLWQRVARLGKRWVEVDEPLSFYRASPDSLARNSKQVLADARIVIGRGFSADPRVRKPASAHANGAASSDGRTASEAVAWVALWNASLDCGKGGASIDPEILRPLPSGYEWAPEIAMAIFDGLMVGSRSAPRQMASRWGSFGTAVTELIAGLGRVWGDPVAARRVQYHLEQKLLDFDDLGGPRRLALTLGIRVDARNPSPTELPEGVDQIYAYLMMDDRAEALVQFGALGRVTSRQWMELILEVIPPLRLAQALPVYHRRAFRRNFVKCTARTLLHSPAALLRPGAGAGRREKLTAEALLAMRGPHGRGSHSEQLRLLEERARTQADLASVPPMTAPRVAAAEGRLGGDRKSYWDRYFATEDPWNYGSPYEQEKYQRQLDILPRGPIGRALELACAEGHFTRQLAPRVSHLTATDISAVALERARERCLGQQNVQFAVLDFCAEALPGDMDLIICSEVLYLLDDLAELRRVSTKLADALAPGGSLVCAAAFVLRDNMERTAFDWDVKFGAQVVSETLAATDGLVLEHSIQTDLYRIDRFRRLRDHETPSDPTIEHVPIRAPIEAKVARHIVRGGARALRSDVARTERRQRIPVLMYHGVADDGPAALARYRLTPALFDRQIRWLRANGFHAIRSEELEWFIANRHPFVGRPVLISFDDGFQNFADNAWPILRGYDMTAEVFLVTDLVGDSARWDADKGRPTPLMDAETVRRLASEGAFFGSHLATHRAIDGLSAADLAAELLRSRMLVERWTSRPTSAFAAPFSVTDRRLSRLARECGYRTGFGARAGVASLDCDPMDLPRIEIRGDRSFDEFVGTMEAALA